ncbi:spore-associated protein A [Kitasatospora sp. CMC57]|uniref:Spore-associated protein A n=1 Tax=Kitasatospora sp. CMC57 TaxID=3231513 RepID=A0AB33JQD8_9ACTN
MRKIQRTMALALSALGTAAGLVSVAAPAEAATTPSGACGSGYYQIDHHALGTVADIYLFYNGSSNCAVTWVRSPNGTRTYDLRVHIERQSDLQDAPDAGFYKYYAGPVKLSAANTCISWGGSAEGISWASGWSHCG